MDRFIGVAGYEKEYLIKTLKSNMDRFIANSITFIVFSFFNFKIQYG